MLATLAAVTVFQMLPEVVGAVELLALIALAKFVGVFEMMLPFVPVDWLSGEFFAAVAAEIGGDEAVVSWGLVLLIGGWMGHSGEVWRDEECFGVIIRYHATRPRIRSAVDRILMSFGLVLVFEFVVAVLAFVLFFVFMAPISDVNNHAAAQRLGSKLTARLPASQISAVFWDNNGTQMEGLPSSWFASVHVLWSSVLAWSRDQTQDGAGDMDRSGCWAKSRSWRWQNIAVREDSGEDRMVDRS